jgi:hypothetical protein
MKVFLLQELNEMIERETNKRLQNPYSREIVEQQVINDLIFYLEKAFEEK